MGLKDVVIVSASRTPFGKFGGAYLQKSAVELGGLAISNTLSAVKLAPEMVSHVYMGTVFPGGLSQVPARQAAFQAGMPKQVLSVGIDKACCSSTEAIIQGVRTIRSGEANAVICGGMENMTQVPYLDKTRRWGDRMGSATCTDYLVDGLTWPTTNTHMGLYAQEAARAQNISREEQDDLALESHIRSASSWEKGYFSNEVFPVTVNKGKQEVLVDKDEQPRADTTIESLSRLRPAFSKDGEVTAGNSSGICDGAAAVLLMTREKAHELGLKPLATIVGYGLVGSNPEDMGYVPAWAISKALADNGLATKDINLFEINEAFAAVTLVSMQALGITKEITNVNGGSVAIGHPVGATGARLVMTLMYELQRRGQTMGAAALCGAGAQGDAIIIKVEA